MRHISLRSLMGMATLASTVAGAQGCVADRPSRNGVFDENQYIRKDFLIQNINGQPDPGWFMKATITQTSTPNPLANLDLFTGAENSGAYVRFGITSDKLSLIDNRELTSDPSVTAQGATEGSIVNAWPITNVDLKYAINLDGEKTNQYQENQELDWQVRQWVKLNFDKNDFSDLAGLGPYQSLMLNKCADGGNASATLVPGSFVVDEADGVMNWAIQVSVPLNLTDADCMTQFGTAGTDFIRMSRSAVTMTVNYSMVRAQPEDPTSYTPLELDEKDSIRHKYGAIEITNYSRDPVTQLVAARELVTRFNPNKPIVFFFAQGYPVAQMDVWRRKGGIVDQTNAIFAKAGAKATLSVLNYNDLTTFGDGKGPVRQYGDVRYSFVRWESDLDTDSPFLAATQFQPDLRTGELISASINVAGAPIGDFVGQRVLAYLENVAGSNLFAASPPDYTKGLAAPGTPQPTLPTSCTIGQTIPLIPAAIQQNVYAKSTLFQKMALYLPPPLDGVAAPGPTDYIYQHTDAAAPTFYSAYLTLLPYITYADPTANQFVTPMPVDGSSGTDTTSTLQPLLTTLSNETNFRNQMAVIDQGGTPTTSSPQDAYAQVDALRQAWHQHDDYRWTWAQPHSLLRGDTADIISFPQVVARSSRHCVGTDGTINGTGAGHWQTQTEWTNQLVQSYQEQTVWHEFGHVLGMEHNFMGSVDRANYPTYVDASGATQYGKYSSSVMDYSSSYDDTDWNNGDVKGGTTQTGWLAYDRGAIGWVYGNNLSPTTKGPVTTTQNVAVSTISGQVSPTAPWNDPYGFARDANGNYVKNAAGTDVETNFLYCNEKHLRYTPLCKQFDVGSTPSEIVAADIEAYDWNYNWTNFRNYYKVWDVSNYGARIADFLSDSRRFMAMAAFDWSNTELTDKLIRIGITPPANAGAVNSGNFYSQLTNEFTSDINAAIQMNAAWHEAIIQQSSGQRNFATTYDPYFGDVTQQGIGLDKEFAFTEWLGLWPYDNYDPSQAAGYYGSSMVSGPGVTSPAQAWSTAASMLGEKGAWDAYPQFFPNAVALFAHDTQNVVFTGLGYPQMRDWIGGYTFTRVEDVLAFFRAIAVANPLQDNGCTDLDTCTYNPMTPQQNQADDGHSDPTNRFIGPDNRRWSWLYLRDRNEYFFVDQDRNPSSYFQVYTYNTDLLTVYDDGNIGSIYSYDEKVKLMIDGYQYYGGLNGNMQQ